MSSFLVFDVESVGLHGEGFAAGWVLLDRAETELFAGYAVCPSARAQGTAEARQWINLNVDPHVPRPTHATPRAVRDAFWAVWQAAREGGAYLVADVSWPVEASFLSACIADDPEARAWLGPYPLLDVSSARFAAGLDPLGDDTPRLPAELPEHHPLCDARRSARFFFEALRRVERLDAAHRRRRSALSPVQERGDDRLEHALRSAAAPPNQLPDHSLRRG